MKTSASSKMRSSAHRRESSSSKYSPHVSGVLLLMKIIQFGPSLFGRRSIISKKIRVFCVGVIEKTLVMAFFSLLCSDCPPPLAALGLLIGETEPPFRRPAKRSAPSPFGRVPYSPGRPQSAVDTYSLSIPRAPPGRTHRRDTDCHNSDEERRSNEDYFLAVLPQWSN